MRKPIRVLLVDDSPLALAALARVLSSAPDIRVVGTARNGRDGLERVAELDPDVVCTDLYMPVMDGLEFTRELMQRYPRPVLVISVAVRAAESQNAFQLLEAGAVDVFAKPRVGIDPADRQTAAELIRKIRVLSGVVVFKRKPAATQPLAVAAVRTGERPIGIIAIGASTGGPQALNTLLSQLPADFPAPILCVQHLGAGFTAPLMAWLSVRCRLKIEFGRPGERPRPGYVYFPREGSQLAIGSSGTLYLAPIEAEGHQYSSVDFTFRSVAEYYRHAAAGVLLSGMGADGAEGMLAIHRQGGMTIAQDEATSIVFGMPASAIANGSVQHVLPLQDIAPFLLQRARRPATAG